MEPLRGDVLVSRITARLEHEVSILSEADSSVCATQDAAVAHACALAKARKVDVWLTEDHTHFMKIASFRSEASARQ